jgi:hypothetical protein
MQTLSARVERGEDMPEIKPGYKSTELYVVVAVLLPWICQQFGLNMATITENAEQLRQAIEAAHGGSDMPVWVAMAYVVGRKLLKWNGK